MWSTLPLNELINELVLILSTCNHLQGIRRYGILLKVLLKIRPDCTCTDSERHQARSNGPPCNLLKETNFLIICHFKGNNLSISTSVK